MAMANHSAGSGNRVAYRCIVYTLAIVVLLSGKAHSRTRTEAQPLRTDRKSLGSQHDRKVLEAYADLPLRFELNRGQSVPQVRFLAQRSSLSLFLTSNEIVMALRAPRLGSPVARKDPITGLDVWSATTAVSAFRMKWVGASPKTIIEGLEELPGKSNYLIGNDRKAWRTDIPSYAKVRYHDIYPGVDLVYYSDGGQLEYDLFISPGAHPEAIRLNFKGTSGMNLDAAGNLILHIDHNELRFRKPTAYQPRPTQSGSNRQLVDARYVLTGRHEVRFALGAHDPSQPLIIDPQLLYSTYIGGSGADGAQKVAVDAQGNAYIVGLTASTDFPTGTPLQATNKGQINAFIVKLDPSAPGPASLIYSTYLGGSGNTIGRGIAVDASGEIYIAGDTDAPDFPSTTGAYQANCKPQSACSSDVFAAKLNSSGSQLLYSTYLGGSANEYGLSLAIDSSGHIFVTGLTLSPDFPVTPGAPQGSFAGGADDAFVAEINPAGGGQSDLLYSTFWGGSGSDHSWGITVGGDGAIYITGDTTSGNFPVTTGAYQPLYSGAGALLAGDAFVTKFLPAGQGINDVKYSTYLGGTADDHGDGITVDASNFVYVTGFTESSNFPVTAQTAYQPTFGGGTCNNTPCADAFIAKLDPSSSGQSSLLYSSFFGGSSFDLAHGIALDSSGLLYVTGETASVDFPLLNPIQSACTAGCPSPFTDVFIAKFDLSKSGTAGLLFSTYLGGSDVDNGLGIAVDSAGNAYVTGGLFSKDFPTVLAFQTFCNNCTSYLSQPSSGDAFLVKVCITACPAAELSSSSVSFAPQDVGTTSSPQSIQLLNSGSGDLTIAKITITGANATDFSQTNCPTKLAPGQNCTIQVTFTPAGAGSRAATLTITDNAGGTPQAVSLSGSGLSNCSPPAAPTGLFATAGNAQASLNWTASSGVVSYNSKRSYRSGGPYTTLATGIATVSYLDTGLTNGITYYYVVSAVNSCGESDNSNHASAIPAALAPSITNMSSTSGPAGTSVTITGMNFGSMQGSSKVTFNGTVAIPASWNSTSIVASVPAGATSGNVLVTVSGVASNGVNFTVTTNGGGWSNGYAYRRTITIDHSKVPNTDQSNFPVLISGTYAYLATTSNGGNVASANGYDIIFTSDSAGSSLLNFEQEKYVALTGELDYWVQVPTVSHSADTIFYMFYGNQGVNSFQSSATATWDSNYAAVYHLADNSANASVKESTANNVFGTANQNTSNTAGQIDGAMAFDGISAAIAASGSAINVSGSFSLEAWVKTSGTANTGTILTNAYGVGGNGYALQLMSLTPSFNANGGNNYYSANAASQISPNVWHLLVGTRVGTRLFLYVDGALSALAVGPSSTPGSNTLNIGDYGGLGQYFGGVLDEIRISKTARSADWIVTEYNNQSSPSTFYSLGPAQ